MARNRSNRNRNNSYRPNLWGALRDVLIASLNKGQLPLMLIGLILLVFAFRLPSDNLLNFLNGIIATLVERCTIGWWVSFGMFILLFLLTRWQRRIHTREVERISKEKKELQEILIGRNLPSSN